MDEVIFKARNLSKKYGKEYALKNAELQIKKGEIYGLVGRNGAGKTTLLKIISGLIHSTEGEIELFGETSKEKLSEVRHRTGSMIETPGFFSYLSARKNLEYYRIQRGIAEKNAVDISLELVGLQNAKDKKFKNFSMGMKQRLGMALAIMGSPDFLILDEPINGLDPEGIVEIRKVLMILNKEKNTTIIISSHILSELSYLATFYGFIDKGKFIEQVSSKALEKKCKKCLSLKVSDTSRASVIIENEFKCSEYEVLNDGEIKIYQNYDKPEVISEMLIKSGVKLFSMNQIGFNLEDYFIDLIGSDKND